MDGHRFDEIARLVASGASRRRVLKGLAAGLAAIAAPVGMGRAKAGKCQLLGEPCDGPSCCDGLVCSEELFECILDCPGDGEECGGKGFCCEGFVCNGQNNCEPVKPICLEQGGECNVQEDLCCEGLDCIDSSCQIPEPVCAELGEVCGGIQAGGVEALCCGDLACIDGFCGIPEETCAALDEPCGFIGTGGDGIECCDDLICVDNLCQEPVPLCSAEGEPCKADSGCCDELICGESGTCETLDDACLDTGEACVEDGECCEGICCAGACQVIECCIDDPNPNDRCDEGTTCFEGICEGVDNLCKTDSDCDDDRCCCDDGTCSGDCCELIPEVDPTAVPTEAPVTELPNTGNGEIEANRNLWVPAGLLGAGAALAARFGLRNVVAPRSVEVSDDK